MTSNSLSYQLLQGPVNIYLFKVNNKNTRKRGKICLKLARKALE